MNFKVVTISYAKIQKKTEKPPFLGQKYVFFFRF